MRNLSMNALYFCNNIQCSECFRWSSVKARLICAMFSFSHDRILFLMCTLDGGDDVNSFVLVKSYLCSFTVIISLVCSIFVLFWLLHIIMMIILRLVHRLHLVVLILVYMSSCAVQYHIKDIVVSIWSYGICDWSSCKRNCIGHSYIVSIVFH